MHETKFSDALLFQQPSVNFNYDILHDSKLVNEISRCKSKSCQSTLVILCAYMSLSWATFGNLPQCTFTFPGLKCEPRGDHCDPASYHVDHQSTRESLAWDGSTLRKVLTLGISEKHSNHASTQKGCVFNFSCFWFLCFGMDLPCSYTICLSSGGVKKMIFSSDKFSLLFRLVAAKHQLYKANIHCINILVKVSCSKTCRSHFPDQPNTDGV